MKTKKLGYLPGQQIFFKLHQRKECVGRAIFRRYHNEWMLVELEKDSRHISPGRRIIYVHPGEVI